MNNSIYLSGSAMKSQLRNLENQTDKLANSTTAGFKGDVSFNEVLWETTDKVGIYNIHNRQALNLEEGEHRMTERELDLSIKGDGFFVIQSGAGRRYTRNGSFKTDNYGYLILEGSGRVMGEGGAIILGAGAIEVKPDGTIFQDGVELDRIKVVQFNAPHNLMREGNSLYRSGEREQPANDKTDVEVLQGYLESSNVSIVDSMAGMITALRHFEYSQRVVRQLLTQSATRANELGRIP